jgi:hypothetical protein
MSARLPPEPFQSAASWQGRQFAEQCDLVLQEHRFTLNSPLVFADLGVDVDRVATSRKGTTVWFEYKGSVRGRRPGLRRTDTLKKAIANGALLRALEARSPFVVLTSHLPERGSGLAMLETAKRLGYLTDVICIYDPHELSRLDLL